MKKTSPRLAVIALLAAAAVWPQRAVSQTVSLTLKDQPMPAALKSIEKAGGKNIIFSYADVENYRVTAVIRQKSEAEAIRTVISGYPLTVRERNRYFVVQRTDKGDRTREISGLVTDDEGNPLPYCTVMLLRSDSTAIDGCATDGNGWFHLATAGKPAALKASFIGYKSEVVAYTDGAEHRIVMHPDAIALKSVEVTNGRRLVEATGRGLLANVIGTPLAKMGSASDMIAHLPLVMSDGSVAGHGKPEIYINNKKVRDAAELDRLRADEVITAEVITLPGVEYGADVTSVIRLKTVRRRGEGLSGSFSAAYSQGERARGSQNAALNYRMPCGADIFVKGYATQSATLVRATSHDQLQASRLWDFSRSTSWRGNSCGYVADIGFNWEINPANSIGLTYTPSSSIGDAVSRTASDEETLLDGAFLERLQSRSETRSKPRMAHALNAYYVGEIGKWRIDFSADFYRGRSFAEMEALTAGTLTAASTTSTANTLVAEKLVAEAPVPLGTLTFGEEASHVRRTSVFVQNGFSSDNDTRQKTTVWSVFANYTAVIGSVAVNAGLRWQNEHNGYYTDGQYNSAMSPDYSVLLPRLSLTYSHGECKHTLAYTVSRYNPPYGLLSPAVNYRSKYEYDTGNPFLKPQTAHGISYSLAWRWLYVQPYYRHESNTIRSFQQAYDDEGHPGVMITDYRNTPRITNYGLFVSMAPRVGAWQINYTATLAFSDQKLEPMGITHNWNGLCASLKLDNSFTLPQGWMLSVTGSIAPYRRSGAAKIKTAGQMDLRLNKSLLKDNALNIALMLTDVLKTGYREMTAYGGINVSTQFREYSDARRIGIDISYKFNAVNSRYKGTHAGQSERSRL